MKKELIQGPIYIALGAAFFGFVPIFLRFSQSDNLHSLAFFRAFFATITIAIFFVIKKLFSNNSVIGIYCSSKIILWSGLLASAIYCYLGAIQRLSITLAVILLFSQVIFVIPLSHFLLKERVRPIVWVLGGVSLMGVCLVTIGDRVTNHSIQEIDWFGVLLGMSAGLFTALNCILSKKWFKGEDSLTLTLNQNFYQVLLFFPFLLLFPPDWKIQLFYSYVGIGTISTALAFFFIYKGIENTKGQLVGILQSTEIVVPILLGSLFFSEIPSKIEILGVLIMFLSYFFSLYLNNKNRNA